MKIDEMLDELLELDSETSRLSDWEIEFIDNLDKYRALGWTAKQCAKLRQIYDEHILGIG